MRHRALPFIRNLSMWTDGSWWSVAMCLSHLATSSRDQQRGSGSKIQYICLYETSCVKCSMWGVYSCQMLHDRSLKSCVSFYLMKYVCSLVWRGLVCHVTEAGIPSYTNEQHYPNCLKQVTFIDRAIQLYFLPFNREHNSHFVLTAGMYIWDYFQWDIVRMWVWFLTIMDIWLFFRAVWCAKINSYI
jgi:hypothetical protein